MDSIDFDYTVTQKALSAMWGINVAYAKPGQPCTRLTPLNMHYEAVAVHEDQDGDFGLVSDLVQTCRLLPGKDLAIAADLIDPHYDYDFTQITDTDKFYRGPLEYKRPCGWKRLGVTVKSVYDMGHNGWLSMKAHDSVWSNSYYATDMAKVMTHMKSRESFVKLCKATYTFDAGVISFADVDEAEKFAQTVEVGGAKYKFLIQNRVNSKAIKKCCDDQVFVCPRESIRPYGFLVKRET